jgi:5'-nucleotidase
LSRPLFLLTNDDGIQSWFLEVLAQALLAHGDVQVVAPATPQSWVGRSLSCRGTVRVEAHHGLPCPAFAVHGTPTDCTHLALRYLLPSPPAVVVSGINLGLNATLPLILSSGTVAGAIEGALQGLPAVALSFRLPSDRFAEIHDAHGRVDGPIADAVRASAEHGAAFAASLVGTPWQAPVVHNLNYPTDMAPGRPTHRTRPAQRRFERLFERTPEDGVFRFRFHPPTRTSDHPEDDDVCLFRGGVSHTVLDLSALGRP